MKIIQSFYILFIVFTPYISMAQNTESLHNTYSRISENAVKHSQAYASLKKATETIGHRMSGTVNGKLAEEFVFKLLQSYGYKPEFQEFEFTSWNRKALGLNIGEDKNSLKKIPAVALAHTPENIEVYAEIIDAGNGIETDFEKLGDKVKGKIVLASLGLSKDTPREVKNLHRSEKTALAEQYGAVGIILYNRVEGGVLLTGTASVTGEIITIPAINIGLEDGLAIKESLFKGSQFASIDMENEIGRKTARNIIVKQTGTEFPDEVIVVGGHLDSWDLATGAIDNGIGSFSVIDVARLFKELNLTSKRSIEFVLFMGEEIGLVGSKHYVEMRKENGQLGQVKYMSNLDMTTNPRNLYSSSNLDIKFLKELAEIIQTELPEFKNEPFAAIGLHSDHQPFMLEGIPVVGLTHSQFLPGTLDCYHADCDNFEYVEEQGLINNVRFQSLLTYYLANVEGIPTDRFTESEIKQQLIDANLEVPLRISGEWRWD